MLKKLFFKFTLQRCEVLCINMLYNLLNDLHNFTIK